MSKRLAYPAVMVAALSAHIAFGISAYLVVALSALAIAGLEKLIPLRSSWMPALSETKEDGAYFLFVQGLLPLLLGFTVSVWISNRSPRLWPDAAPLAVQVLLMILAAGFLRYWLHVACHRNAVLWRLHSVHHEPDKMYWLNAARFHPLEKGLQYLLDALPFAFLGVGEEVLAIYFILYSLNGFFQHSNADVRLGFLNHVVCGPELHRWHHSVKLEEALSNYGNILTVWDTVFGTRYLPAEPREVSEVGIRGGRSRLGLFERILRFRLWIVRHTTRRSFASAARRPRAAQMETLRRILSENEETPFGVEHGFSDIESLDEFRARVPVQNYESLRRYLETQRPVMFARTSGTTDLPKLIPVFSSTLAGLRRRQSLATLSVYETCPEAFAGKMLALASPAVEGRLPSGIPFGSASGYLYETMPALARRKYVIPKETFAIEDHETKYRQILLLALAERNITLIAAANPSTLLKLSDVLRGLLGNETLTLKDVFTNLKAVVTWTGGSAGFALRRLKAELPESVPIMEMGYLASEVFGTVPVGNGLEAPTLQDHFFEFVEKDAYERGESIARTLDELEEGREYYVLVTTAAGLYRYFMNDILRVTGRFENTPTLAFVQKGKGVTSITGEKLYESQVLQAMRLVEIDLDLTARFFVLLADAEGAFYRLLVEASPAPPEPSTLAEALDRRLSELNLEYGVKRASGRLLPPIANLLRSGAGEAYKKLCLDRGQREAQFKTLALQYAGEFSFPWSSWA